ncbi:MAG TPA: hypothetical protein VMT68_20625 [Caulobacteraceae bacterium]|nr:hypothetical protein [Caulobacteraceae bacterium]
MRRLALFWLICAATGFAVAAMAAFVLSLTIDHEAIWRETPPTPIAKVLDALNPTPRPSGNGRVSPG